MLLEGAISDRTRYRFDRRARIDNLVRDIFPVVVRVRSTSPTFGMAMNATALEEAPILFACPVFFRLRRENLQEYRAR